LAAARARTARPDSVGAAAELFRAAAREEGTLLFCGSGSKLDWGTPLSSVDLVAESSGLNRILAHDAADMTVAVEAGVPLADLQNLLAGTGQWLGVDPASAGPGATVGGLVATADSGPRRLKYGALRDLVIGITVVLADGTVAHSGGRVIKNVAGYDLARLFTGSLGALGMIAEVIFRLHPRPTASRTVRLRRAAEDAFPLSMEVCGGAIEPTAVEWDNGELLVRIEGQPGPVDFQVTAILGRVEGADAEVLDGAAEAEAWEGVRRHLDGEPGQTVVRAGTLPSRLPHVLKALRESAAGAGVEAKLCSSVVLGIHTAVLSGGSAAEHAACLDDWRRRLGSPTLASVSVRRRLEGLAEVADLWGPPSSSVQLMRRVKQQFDPHDRCARGRFSPWF
jgi:glycolate oxidase FAD binding subunit